MMLEAIDDAIQFGYPTLLLGETFIEALQDEGIIKKYKYRAYRERQREKLQKIIYGVIKSKPWIIYENPPKPTFLTIGEKTINNWKALLETCDSSVTR